MSLIVSTPQQICYSPLNSSKSKMLFSFPKDKRFIDESKSAANPIFYDLPTLRSKRAAGIGYGHKYDFTEGKATSPAPNAYDVKGIFDANRKKGKSFGLGREQMQVTGAQYVGEKKSPGPGAYDTRDLNKVKISFTFRAKTSTDKLSSVKDVPGPGTYPVVDNLNKEGNYHTSKFKNSGATLISPSKIDRSLTTSGHIKIPGPGAYDPKTSMNLTGSYFVSKFKSTLGRSFGHSIRVTATSGYLENTPGPGAYRLPSEFGYYESKSTTNLRRPVDSLKTEESMNPAKVKAHSKSPSKDKAPEATA